MDFLVARLMGLNEQELRCLRSDQELQSHLQRTHLLVESKLQQYSNASGLTINVLAATDANYALDLRLSEHQQNQLSEHNQQQLQQLHQLQLQIHYQHQRQQQLHQQQLYHHQQQQQHLPQQQQQERCFNYKKMKFIEWTSTSGGHDEGPLTPPASAASTALARDDSAGSPQSANNTPLSTPTPTNSDHMSPLGGQELTLAPTPQTRTGGKKYKGEFDEPNTLEVELRLKLLMRDDNYHSKNSPAGECACILGSEFKDKTASSVLMMVEQWRQLPTEQRVTFKWDMNDLPKDIQLSDIKRFENLRREASSGRADFGGASKRKPLGIRGTRQFLLILYCLWGHPGRDDPMQREGYCPHCFAKIKKPNEQSTLVRVVNHFNMKHRRGANPRT